MTDEELRAAPASTGATDGRPTSVDEEGDPSSRVTSWLPSALVVGTTIVGLAANDGGYFPTTWGPAIMLLAAVIGLWLVIDGRTDAGRPEAGLLAALGAFAVWMGLSATWSVAPSLTILEVQRAAVVVLAVGAAVVLTRRSTQVQIAAAVLIAVTGIVAYSVATRLFPEQAGPFNAIDGYRLSGVIGYWNGLGIFAALGALVALGIATDARSRPLRIVSFVALVPLLCGLYYTFSRGGWLALFLGMLGMIAVSPSRVRLVAAMALALTAPSLVVALSSTATGLTHQDATLEEAVAAGRQVAAGMALLAVAAGLIGFLWTILDERVTLRDGTRRMVGATMGATAIAVVAAGLFAAGGPVSVAERAIDGFQRTVTPSDEIDLNDHLFQFSGSHRVHLWEVAAETYRAHPGLGIGAGAFERVWQAEPDAPQKVRDAHNIYLEALAEMGPVGITLVVLIVLVALGANVRARRQPMATAAFGATLAYAFHAGVDWDWELTAVTVTALLVATFGMTGMRGEVTRALPVSARAALGVVVVGIAVLGFVGYVGSTALVKARSAIEDRDAATAVGQATTATSWAPWSTYAFTTQGEARLLAGDLAGARRSFTKATELEPGYWRAWLGLAAATSGKVREEAFDRASRLYPRSGEIYETEQRLRADAE